MSIDIMSLSPQERLDLIGDLCDSLAGEELPISDALKEELDRRNASFLADRAKAVSWSEVRKRLEP